MVDVIRGLIFGLHSKHFLHDGYHVSKRKHSVVILRVQVKPAVQFVASHTSQSVASRILKKPPEVVSCVLDSGKLIRAESPENVLYGLVRAAGFVARKSPRQSRIHIVNVYACVLVGIVLVKFGYSLFIY